jgi:hypothetical protein
MDGWVQKKDGAAAARQLERGERKHARAREEEEEGARLPAGCLPRRRTAAAAARRPAPGARARA